MPQPAKTGLPVLVIMGVSGSGKTTVGTALAERLGWNYQEGDAFHPAANVAKLRAGHPLRDEDRKPWLAAIARWIDACRASHMPGIVSCSALKQSYREFLRADRPEVWFVYLRVPRAKLQRRVAGRDHEYMPASLLDSQLRTLQEPASDEPRTLRVDAAGSIGDTADVILQRLRNTGILQAEPVTKLQRQASDDRLRARFHPFQSRRTIPVNTHAGQTIATIIPSLRYRDATAMIEWLCNAFGFEKHAVYADGNVVQHAQLAFGNGMVMLGSVDNESAWGRRIAQPDEIGGRETQACYVVVADCAAHYARAKTAGAEIVDELETKDYGGSGYSCHDPEGHLWSFGDYDPWAEPAA